MRNKQLLFGTWQFSGGPKFADLSDREVKQLLYTGILEGIDGFDTALAYGNGRVEKLIGEVLTESNPSYPCNIITKIPAITKPALDTNEPIETYYPKEHVIQCINSSLSNLGVKTLDTVLLHNWSQNWLSEEYMYIQDILLPIKQAKKINKVGISLPNDFELLLDSNIINSIDTLELPYNEANMWSTNYLPLLKTTEVELILRSTLSTGESSKRNDFCIECHLEKIISLSCSLTIGMTSEGQIHTNCKQFKNLITKTI